jgi:hypothetical protein
MVNIKNLSLLAVFFTLNSGIDVILGPGEETEVAETEVRGNPIIKKLEERGTIGVSGVVKKSTPRNASAQGGAAGTASPYKRAETKKGKH